MEQINQSLHNALRRFVGGDEIHAYAFMGCHRGKRDGTDGYVFRVWAPNAKAVSVVGDWNAWSPDALVMQLLEYGVWEAFAPDAREGALYQYYIVGQDGAQYYRGDPFAFASGERSDTHSCILTCTDFAWTDESYRKQQGKRKLTDAPMNIYEAELSAWKQAKDRRALARELVSYLKEMGYSHLELLPLTKRADGHSMSAFYAPAAQYGTPDEIMYLVDLCHAEGIGVLLDWAALCFPREEQGLGEFDGGFCFESADALMRDYDDSSLRAFDVQKGEVQSFLISNAVFWLEMYHVDGLRIGGVDAMLYLDYGRRDYRPNLYGGKEHIDGIAFLRKLNRAIFAVRRNALTCAQESTAFPLVTKPDYDGGLGFLFKWDENWLQNMRPYMELDPLWRKGSHERLTAAMRYAYAENFVLTLSEAALAEAPLLQSMPGSEDDRFANLRLLYGFQMAHPGKKLQCMGSELAPLVPRPPGREIEWALLKKERHKQMQCFVRDLNHFYLGNSPLWNCDTEPEGFEWLSTDDRDNSVIALRRLDRRGREIIAILNFCPVVRENYCLGLPRMGEYDPILNSDDAKYGGGGTPLHSVFSIKKPLHGQPCSGEFTLAPLSVTFYKRKVLQR